MTKQAVHMIGSLGGNPALLKPEPLFCPAFSDHVSNFMPTNTRFLQVIWTGPISLIVCWIYNVPSPTSRHDRVERVRTLIFSFMTQWHRTGIPEAASICIHTRRGYISLPPRAPDGPETPRRSISHHTHTHTHTHNFHHTHFVG